MTPADQLALYRSSHRIQEQDGRCAVDGLRVYPVKGGRLRHDPGDVERAACPLCGPGLRPSHFASPACESGRRNHCSCDVCF